MERICTLTNNPVWMEREHGLAFQTVAPTEQRFLQVLRYVRNMVARPRSTSDVRAKHVEVTRAGVAVLRRALPVVPEVQRRLFGEEGRVGGGLLTALLRLDCEPMEEAKQRFREAE